MRFVLLVIILFLPACVSTTIEGGRTHYDVSVDVENQGHPSQGGFCGLSTYGKCEYDSECIKGGCSGQICQSVNEDSIITTCEYRDCYNANKYNLRCKCLGDKCQWTR